MPSKLAPKVDLWKGEFLEDIGLLVQGKPVQSRRVFQKACAYILAPIACLPCIGYSLFWRVVACPFQCLGKGPGACCSDNGCTLGSDASISLCYSSIQNSYPWLPYAYECDDALAGVIRDTLVKGFETATLCKDPDHQRAAIRYINQTLVRLDKPKVYILHESLTVAKFEAMLRE